MKPGDLAHNRQGRLGPGQQECFASYMRQLPSSVVEMSAAASELARFIEGGKADLEQGRVIAVDGEVACDLQEIAAIQADSPQTGNGHRMLSACHSASRAHCEGRAPAGFLPGFGLWPGRYKLYLLPHSNLVVGTEPYPTPRESAQGLLMAAQRITEETLGVNRQGRMTEAQRQATAKAEAAPYAVLVAFLALLLGGIAYFEVNKALEKGKSILSAEPLILLVLVLGLVAALPPLLLSQRKAQANIKADAQEGRLSALDGVASKSHSMYRGTLRLSLTLDQREFDVSETPAIFAAVVEGHRYRAWVAPRSGRLLALEFLESPAVS